MAELERKLVAETATWLSITSQLFQSRMAALLKPFGLTPAQFGILNHLLRHGGSEGLRVSDIAAAVEVGQPAVTKAMARFRAMGLVAIQDSPDDRRSHRVVALPEAGALVGQIHAGIGPDLMRCLGALRAEDVEDFAKHLKTLALWLDENRLT